MACGALCLVDGGGPMLVPHVPAELVVQVAVTSRQSMSAYEDSWLPARADPRMRTWELCRWLLDEYVLPQLVHLPLHQVTPSVARAWHATLSRDGSPTPASQAYALLRAMLNTAVADELFPEPVHRPRRRGGLQRRAQRGVTVLAAWSGARWASSSPSALIALTSTAARCGSTGST